MVIDDASFDIVNDGEKSWPVFQDVLLCMGSVLIEMRQTVLLEESSLRVIEDKSTHHVEFPGMELSMVVTMNRSN